MRRSRESLIQHIAAFANICSSERDRSQARSCARRWDALADFRDAIGEHEVAPLLKATRIANESLSAEAVHFCDAIARVAREAKAWPLRQHAQDAPAGFPGRPFMRPEAEAARIRDESAPDVAWSTARPGGDPFEGVETPPGALDWDIPQETLTYFAGLALEAARARLAHSETGRAKMSP